MICKRGFGLDPGGGEEATVYFNKEHSPYANSKPQNKNIHLTYLLVSPQRLLVFRMMGKRGFGLDRAGRDGVVKQEGPPPLGPTSGLWSKEDIY